MGGRCRPPVSAASSHFCGRLPACLPACRPALPACCPSVCRVRVFTFVIGCATGVYSCNHSWLQLSTPARYCWGNFGRAVAVAVMATRPAMQTTTALTSSPPRTPHARRPHPSSHGGRGGSSWAAVAVRPYPPRPPAPRPTHPRPPPHALAKPQNGRR